MIAGLTENLSESFKTEPLKVQRNMELSLSHYIQEYTKARKIHNAASVAFTFAEEMETAMNKNLAQHADTAKEISCKKGCHFCCRIAVAITNDEAILLKEVARQENITIDYDRLEKQKGKDASTWKELKGDDRSCVFLNKKGECSIYNYRPMNCRKYLVVTPPANCDLDSPISGVHRLNLTLPEIIASAAFTVAGCDFMPEQLLKIKDTDFSNDD